MRIFTLILLFGTCASADLYRLQASCFGQQMQSWNLQITGDGTDWSATTRIYRGAYRANRSDNLISEQSTSDVLISRNYPDFGFAGVMVKLQARGSVPYKSFSVAVPIDDPGAYTTEMGFASIKAGVPVEELRCSVVTTSNWKSLIQDHKLHELIEPVPDAVCQIHYLPDLPHQPKKICSGVMISPQHILTEGHCDLLYDEMPDVEVRCPGKNPARVLKRSVHPDYARYEVSPRHDVAIYELSEALNITPMDLATDFEGTLQLILTQPERCRMYGYGQRGPHRSGLAVAPLQPPPDFLGGRALMEKDMRSEGVISSDPEFFMREGDSGGPILCQFPDGVTRAVGVHSALYTPEMVAQSTLLMQNNFWIFNQIQSN